MKLLRSRSTARARNHLWPVLLAVFLLALVSPVCQAQRNSAAATITLTAVLSQSLSLSVAPEIVNELPSHSFSDAKNDLPLTIVAHWVRGPATVSMRAYSPAEPFVDPAGRKRILVGTASPPVVARSSLSGESFVAPPDTSRLGSPTLQISTNDLQTPPGSESAILTIRADAF